MSLYEMNGFFPRCSQGGSISGTSQPLGSEVGGAFGRAVGGATEAGGLQKQQQQEVYSCLRELKQLVSPANAYANKMSILTTLQKAIIQVCIASQRRRKQDEHPSYPPEGDHSGMTGK